MKALLAGGSLSASPLVAGRSAFGRPRHLTKACRERTSGTQGIVRYTCFEKKGPELQQKVCDSRLTTSIIYVLRSYIIWY